MKLNLALIATALFSTMVAAAPTAANETSLLDSAPPGLAVIERLSDSFDGNLPLQKREEYSFNKLQAEMYDVLKDINRALQYFGAGDSFKYEEFMDNREAVATTINWLYKVLPQAYQDGVDFGPMYNEVHRLFTAMMTAAETLEKYAQNQQPAYMMVKTVVLTNVDICRSYLYMDDQQQLWQIIETYTSRLEEVSEQIHAMGNVPQEVTDLIYQEIEKGREEIESVKRNEANGRMEEHTEIKEYERGFIQEVTGGQKKQAQNSGSRGQSSQNQGNNGQNAQNRADFGQNQGSYERNNQHCPQL